MMFGGRYGDLGQALPSDPGYAGRQYAETHGKPNATLPREWELLERAHHKGCEIPFYV